MAKRGRRKKTNKIDLNIAVVVLVLLSILLMILIYTKSGRLGAELSPMLGGIMGFIKYIIPIGLLLIAIYMTNNDKEFITHKLIQYGVFLICVATLLTLFQCDINTNKEFSEVIEDCYYQGEKDVGGGAIGAVIAFPLITLLGKIGAIILTIGISLIMLIFMFGIRPAEMISDFLDNMKEKREERLERMSKNSYAEQEEKHKETKVEKRLREKAEAEKLASQIENQLTINLNDNQNDDDGISIPFFGKKKGKQKEEMDSPDVIDSNLFKQVEEEKAELGW